MGGTWSAHRRDGQDVQNTWREVVTSGVWDVCGRMGLKFIIKKCNVKMWLGPVLGSCDHDNEPLVPQRWRMSWPAKWLPPFSRRTLFHGSVILISLHFFLTCDLDENIYVLCFTQLIFYSLTMGIIWSMFQFFLRLASLNITWTDVTAEAWQWNLMACVLCWKPRFYSFLSLHVPGALSYQFPN